MKNSESRNSWAVAEASFHRQSAHENINKKGILRRFWQKIQEEFKQFITQYKYQYHGLFPDEFW